VREQEARDEKANKAGPCLTRPGALRSKEGTSSGRSFGVMASETPCSIFVERGSVAD
jgi:hypothetical protein